MYMHVACVRWARRREAATKNERIELKNDEWEKEVTKEANESETEWEIKRKKRNANKDNRNELSKTENSSPKIYVTKMRSPNWVSL